MKPERKMNDGSEIFLTKWNWKDVIYFVLLHFTYNVALETQLPCMCETFIIKNKKCKIMCSGCFLLKKPFKCTYKPKTNLSAKHILIIIYYFVPANEKEEDKGKASFIFEKINSLEVRVKRYIIPPKDLFVFTK